jgi:class 3 adenylate cyclase/tetratricopeptide (TPR) repeat protein
MGNIFISHVISDEPLMRELAQGLEQAGYVAWFFERDVLPGPSYLVQITQAMEECDAVVLLVTPAALSSDQVTKEVVGAFERRIPFVPVLVGVTPPELKDSQPEWRHALGGTAMLCCEEEKDLSTTIPKVIEGLKAMDIMPEGEEASTTTLGIPTPRYISEKILSTRASMEGERKQVTVLFADVAGFTSLSEKLDPEEVRDLIQPVINIMAEEVHAYEGTVAQFTGDGLMALFGAPLAHEDAPQRAIYSAVAMQRRLGEYGEKLSSKSIDLQLRIGINTGLVIVGRIGDDLSMEYTALGDTVNLASRMESAAEPGTVQVAESTFRLTEGYFEFQDLGETSVKGKDIPVKAYRVLGPGPAKTRIDASLARGLTPFVGREWEIENLTRAFNQARTGQGQVVGVVGEPGMGKSRLILEFREALPSNEHTYLEGNCIHYGEAIAYLPILGILRNYFDVSEGEQEEESKRKMDAKLYQLNAELSRTLPPLQELLSITVDDESYLSLEPAQRRERVFEAIRYLFIAESQRNPLILAIEDLHWIDKTSEEFLASLIDSIPGASILLLLLYRPEYTPAWVSKTFYSQIRVEHLPEVPSIELAKAILSEGEVSPELSDFIVGRTAGNPLFIEELTRGLLEAGSIVKDNEHYVLSTKPSDIQVPETIQGIIASRLDRLPEEAKDTLQVASVIGREFSLRLLEDVTGISKPLKSYLLQLQSLEFIYEMSLFPEPEYIFKHALTQEVAYNSLLLKRRRDLHEKIGHAIEQLYEGTLEEFYETLAYHYSHSEDNEKAIYYLKLSGDKATRAYSNWEAVNFYRKAIQALDDKQGVDENKNEKLELYLSVFNPLTWLGFPEGSLETLQVAEKLAKELGDDASLTAVYSKSSLYYSFKGDMSKGLEYYKMCFNLAEKMGDVDTMAMIAQDVDALMAYTGRWLELAVISRSVIQHLEEKRREKDLFSGGVSIYVNQCGYCLLALGMIGELEEAKSVMEKGLKSAYEVGDTNGMGFVELNCALVSYCQGDSDGTIDHARKAIEHLEDIQVEILLGTAWSYLGVGYYFIGDYEAARAHAEKGLEIQKRSGLAAMIPFIYYLLALILLADGDHDGALESAEEALKLSREFVAPTFEATALIVLGRIMGESDSFKFRAAEKHIRHGISLGDELQMKPPVAQGYLFLGEVFELAGRREEALENLRKAEEMYQEMGVDPNSYWLTRTREARARLDQD